MIARWIAIAGILLALSGAVRAAEREAVSSMHECLSASLQRFDQPEERQLQATRLLNMLASMVRERSPLLAKGLVLLGLILKFITHPTVLRVLLILLVVGIAASSALVAWGARQRRLAARAASAAPPRRTFRPPPQIQDLD